MQCPKCKSELEISCIDVDSDRKGLHVKIACSDYICPFFKVLELRLEDIIGIGRSPETEAETKSAIARAMES